MQGPSADPRDLDRASGAAQDGRFTDRAGSDDTASRRDADGLIEMAIRKLDVAALQAAADAA